VFPSGLEVLGVLVIIAFLFGRFLFHYVSGLTLFIFLLASLPVHPPIHSHYPCVQGLSLHSYRGPNSHSPFPISHPHPQSQT
jgi:hypothetical protein